MATCQLGADKLYTYSVLIGYPGHLSYHRH